MMSTGQITRNPLVRMRILVGLQLAWLGTVSLLAFWWSRLLLKQAKQIAELELRSGIPAEMVNVEWLRTHRMLSWESGAFFLFLVASMALMIGIYWRDRLRSRSIQAFFASVTHELKTPLTSIRLQAESMADALSANTEVRDLSERLMEDTLRLETQVERVLELARLEGGGPVYTRTVGLRQLVDRFVSGWEPTYRGKVEIVNEVGDVEVVADPRAAHLILRNLFENSIRHSRKSKTRLELRSVRKEGRIELVVSDNGAAGSNQEGLLNLPAVSKLGKLFEKGAASQGTGVGLYLVKTLMERVGGGVRFHGLVGMGTADAGFKVSLFFIEGPDSLKENGPHA